MLKKTEIRSPLIVALWLFISLVGTCSTSAQGHYIFGYWRVVFGTGSNLFNNPCQSGGNSLSELFPVPPYPAPTPEGTTVSLWDPTTTAFSLTSTLSNGTWSTNLILPPGTGCLLVTPSAFTNVIEGYLLGHDGIPITNSAGLSFLPPPRFSGPDGIYLLGDKAPVANNTGTNIFINVLGRVPFPGEQIASLSGTSTYLGRGLWDLVPSLGVGQAAFFHVMSEPAPLLTIIYTNNQAIISWPSSASFWTLQTNNNLATGAWGDFLGSNVNSTVAIPSPTGSLFFRLSYP